MKIAICISGFLRTWKYAKNNFINVFINDLKCQGGEGTIVDIFVHTYHQNHYDSDVDSPPNEYLTKKEIIHEFECLNFAGVGVVDAVIEDRCEVIEMLEKEGKNT